MRFMVTVPVLLLSVLVPAHPARADASVLVALGEKRLDQDDWPEADEHSDLGLVMSYGGQEWPVRIAFDLLFSIEEVDVGPGVAALDEWTLEFDLGVRKVWQRGRTRPFVGGGVGIIGGSRELLAFPGVVASDSDSALGPWVDAGVVWHLGRGFELGFEGRVSRAEIELEEDVDAGGTHLLLLFGWASGPPNPPASVESPSDSAPAGPR